MYGNHHLFSSFFLSVLRLILLIWEGQESLSMSCTHSQRFKIQVILLFNINTKLQLYSIMDEYVTISIARLS